MIRPDLVEYVKGQIKKGRSNEEIKNLLSSAGWQSQDIEDSLRAASEPGIPMPPSGGESMYGNPAGYSNTSYLPGAGALLEEAWRIYRPRFKTFIGILGVQIIMMIIFVGILFIIGILFSGIMSSFGTHAATDNPGFIMQTPPPAIPSPNPAAVAINVINWLLGFAVILAVMGLMIMPAIWGQAALIYAIKDSSEGIGVIESYRRGWHKIGSVAWVGLLSVIIIFSGFMLFVIPGIILAIWFSLAAYIVVVEDVGGISALMKSREYIRGRGWEVFGLMLVMLLIMVGISIGSQFIFGILGAIFAAIGLSFMTIIFALFNQAISFAIAPLSTIFSFLIYHHLKQIKGDFAFTPSQGSKMKYLAVVVLGILMVLLVFGGFISLIFGNTDGGRPKANVAAYKSSVSSIQAAVVMCCDNPNSNLRTTPGADVCDPKLGVNLLTAQQLRITDVIYSVAPNGTCKDEDPGLIVIPRGLSISACNTPTTVRSSGVKFPPGC